MQVIFMGAYWLRFWAPLQRDEQTKDILASISKRLETIALEISNRGWKHIYCYFRVLVNVSDRGLLLLFIPKLYNNWLCTSLYVEAGYCFIPYVKKCTMHLGSLPSLS
jgi:hypothetical protein